MKAILAPIDFSRVSRTVVDEAIVLARAIRARVILMHVVQPPAIITDFVPLAGEALQVADEIERGAKRHLARWQKILMKRGVTVETICGQGFPAVLIVARARQVGASYIVVGSHGHGAFYDLVLGGTASGVLRRAPCPVVVVPARPKARASRGRIK